MRFGRQRKFRCVSGFSREMSLYFVYRPPHSQSGAAQNFVGFPRTFL